MHVCRHSIMLASSAVSLSHFICLGLRPRTCNLLIKYRMSFKPRKLQRVVACGGRGHDTLYHKSQLKMPFKLSLYTVYCHVAGTVSVSLSLSFFSCCCRILTAFPTVILFSSALFFSHHHHRHHYYHHYHADYPVC